MEWILGKLIAWPIIGPFIKMVGGFVLDYHKQNLDAQGSHEIQVSTVVEKSIELDKREAELNTATVVAEQGNWVTRSVRPLMATPFIIFLFKVVVWDKVIGSFVGCSGTVEAGTCRTFLTDPLDPKMWGVFMAVVIAYMGGRTAERVADKISGIWKK